MIIIMLLLAILIGLLRGGTLKNILDLKIAHGYLFFLSVIIDFGLLFMMRRYDLQSARFIYVAVMVQYLLLFICLWINRKLPFISVTALGVFLNYAVIMLNQGRMPFSQKALQAQEVYRNVALLEAGKYLTYQVVGPETRLWFLGDVIYMPQPLHSFISIGDILLVAGIFLLVQQVVAGKRKKETVTF